MSLLKYFKPVSGNGLPDPRGPLSELLPARAIEAANKEVEKSKQPKKRGTYNCFSSEQRAKIGKYACENGVVAASKFFSKGLNKKINESTVRGIKIGYLSELSRKRKAEKDLAILYLPTAKRGRPLLLGSDIDKMVQIYLKKLREGGAVSARIAISSAKGILLTCNKTMLEEYGGPVVLGISWAHSLLKRMGFV